MQAISFTLISENEEHMKKAIKVLFFIIGFCAFVLVACMLLPDPYGKSYQRGLSRQYDYYSSLEDNKMVFLGSSSLSFGFDLDTMEELTGKPCAILGNHFGYGMAYLMEMSKSNLKPGDIVVVEIPDHQIDTCAEDLLLSGIGHNYEMYRFFIPETWAQVISYYPSYIKKALMYDLNGGYDPGDDGAYSINSFDERGNMIYERPECVIPVPYDERALDYTHIRFSGTPYQAEYVEFVNNYISYCEDMGVAVYITLPCYFSEAIVSSEEDILAFEEMLKEQFNAPLISKVSDYIFDRDRLYDNAMHCNTEGAKYRTELIYNDLIKAGALD